MSTAAFLGSQFLINSTTAGNQRYSQVATLSNGQFAVVWENNNPVSGDPDLVGRIFNANGTAAGAEFVVANTQSDNEQRVSLAPLGTGFVATWHDVQLQDVLKKEFSATGALLTGPTKIADVANVNVAPRVAVSPTGTTMTVWADVASSGADVGSFNVYARGTGGVVLVNTTLTDNQQFVSVAPLSDGTGNFIVVWIDEPVNAAKVLRGQVINAAGAKVGGELIVDSDVGGGEPTQVAGRPGGGYAISWVDFFNVRVQTYASGGASLGGFQANPIGEGSYLHGFATLSNGLYALAFEDFSTATRTTVRVFAPDGTPIGSNMILSHAAGPGAFTGSPSIAALASGQFVVTFGDADNPQAESDIAGQRFSTSTIAFIEGTAAANSFNGATQTGFFLGYDGIDTLTYASAGAGVTVNRAIPTANLGAAAGDEIGVSVEIVTGSNFNDALVGDADANTFNGGGASDLIFGGAGIDTLNGDAGGDFIDGGAGADAMNGGADFDTVSWLNETQRVVVNLTNQSQNNFAALGDTATNFESFYLTNFDDGFTNNGSGGYIYGFAGADNIIGGAGSDIVDGGAGADALDGGAGFDYASWSSATTGVTINLNNQALNAGGAAGDTVLNFEVYYFTEQADTFTGINSGASIAYGYGGADVLTGGANSNDWLFGGDGADTLDGGALNDLMSGGAGSDNYIYTTWVGAGFDSILDFTGGADKFRMTASNFGLTAGAVLQNGVNFIVGASPVATNAQPTFMYSSTFGILYFDLDGSGTAFAATALAQISGAPALAVGDFVFV